MTDEPKPKLLIIEDDPGLQSQMRWCFDAAIEVSVAADFDSAVTAFRREAPQVVTLDLGLPPDPGGATVGFQLLTELLRLDSRVKIIVITGREEHGHRQLRWSHRHRKWTAPHRRNYIRQQVSRLRQTHRLAVMGGVASSGG